MIVIILAGGKSARLVRLREKTIAAEKALIAINGIKLVDRIVEAVRNSKADGFLIATSPNTPKTIEYCKLKGYEVILTHGKGYHEDLQQLLEIFPCFISVAVDLPFISGEHINALIDSYNKKKSNKIAAIPLDILPAGVVPSYVFNHRGRTLVAVGLNVVTTSTPSEDVIILTDRLIGVNVNTPEDLKFAMNLCQLCVLSL